jgi:hypothetical protein
MPANAAKAVENALAESSLNNTEQNRSADKEMESLHT